MATRKDVRLAGVETPRGSEWETLVIVAAAGAAIAATLFWFWLCLSSQFM